jgi:hypothetical protein
MQSPKTRPFCAELFKGESSNTLSGSPTSELPVTDQSVAQESMEFCQNWMHNGLRLARSGGISGQKRA